VSLDKTLKLKSSLERHRNVLTRAERIDTLKETNRWTDSSTALGLPKVAHRKAAVGKKTKAKAGEEGAAAEKPATEEKKA